MRYQAVHNCCRERAQTAFKVNRLCIGPVPEGNRVGENPNGNEFIKNGWIEAIMSEQGTRRNSENANVLQMRDRKAPDRL